MSDPDSLKASELAEQWIFDYYLNKCVTQFLQDEDQDGKFDNNWREILQMVMDQSIEVEHGHNRVKAHMLIVLSHQLHLVDTDIASLADTNINKILKTRKEAVELLNLLDELQTSLIFLQSSKDIKTESIQKLCQQCLLHTYVFMFQVASQLGQASEPVLSKQELDKLMKKTCDMLEKTIDVTHTREKKILQTCKKIQTENAEFDKCDLPQPIDLPISLAQLVGCIHEKISSQPCLLEVAKSWIRAEQELAKEKDEDLLSPRHSMVADLVRVDNENTTTSTTTEEGRSRGTKRTHRLARERERDISDDESSDFSSTESITSATRDVSKKSREDRGHRSRPGVSGLQHRFRDLDTNMKHNRPVEKLVKKPASHAVVKIGPWTPEEEEKFVVSVLKFGPGRWVDVKEDIQAVRSTVQLKDKWRALPKSRIRSIALQHGLSLSKHKL